MRKREVLGRAAAIIAGLAAAIIAVNAQAAFAGAAPTLSASGGADLFAGAGILAPGGPAVVRQAVVTFTGSAPSRAAGLYLANFQSRAATSAPACTAGDPGAKFDFTVSERGRLLYAGTLAGFASTHFDPATRLALPGRGGLVNRWAPGDRVTVDLAVSLDGSADDSDMGCTSAAQFDWFAE